MNKLFMFTLGVTVGSLVTWKIVEEKYKRLADEEIASVVERFKKRDDKKDENEETKMIEHEIENDTLDDSNNEYKKMVNALGYSREQDDDCIIEIETMDDYIKPYVISPAEFGEFGNDVKSWTYYADGVLVDENDEIVNDPEIIIGNALECFGEYDDDCVHVRNEMLECDYEIFKHEKTFSEINKEDN